MATRCEEWTSVGKDSDAGKNTGSQKEGDSVVEMKWLESITNSSGHEFEQTLVETVWGTGKPRCATVLWGHKAGQNLETEQQSEKAVLAPVPSWCLTQSQ